MSLASFVLGHRAFDNAYGVFIAPPGVDAATALAAALSLDISASIPQIILAGAVSSFPSTVTLPSGLLTIPLVLLTSFANQNGNGVGNVRPYGNPTSGVGNISQGTVSTSSLILTSPFASIGYLVFSQAV